MDKMLFGISWLPIVDGLSKFNYVSGIEYLKSIGIDAMEFANVVTVNVTDKNAPGILDAKNKNNFYLSAHGSYNYETKKKTRKKIKHFEEKARDIGNFLTWKIKRKLLVEKQE